MFVSSPEVAAEQKHLDDHEARWRAIKSDVRAIARPAEFRHRKLRLIELTNSVQPPSLDGEDACIADAVPAADMGGVYAYYARSASTPYDISRFVALALHAERYGARDDDEANAAREQAERVAHADAARLEAALRDG